MLSKPYYYDRRKVPSDLKNAYKYRKRPRRTDQYNTRVRHDFYISTITLKHIDVTCGARRPNMAAFVAWIRKLGAADLTLQSRLARSATWRSMRRVVVSDDRWFVSKRHVTHHADVRQKKHVTQWNNHLANISPSLMHIVKGGWCWDGSILCMTSQVLKLAKNSQLIQMPLNLCDRSTAKIPH